jgi:predicted Ser/Thr protein kinase
MSEPTQPVERERLPAADGPLIGGCRLGAVVGRGGMGTVYRAMQVALAREVAVKVVPAAGIEDAGIARFKREARIAARLDHPNCVPIYAAGEDDAVLYLVMKLIHGPNLGALVAREGPLSPERAVEVVEQVAAALDAAHAAGLVHRDVKPSNVLIELRKEGERAYLSDFGLMREVIEDAEITRTHEWVGTIDYASPEQLQGLALDRHADVYALAGVLYTAVAGGRPFPRESPTATAWAHLNLPAPQLGGHPLDRVIARGMAKRPEDRYGSAGELARAARAAVAPTPTAPAMPTQPPARTPAPAPAPAPAPTTVSLAQPPPPRRRRAGRSRRAAIAWVSAAALLVVAAVVLALMLGSGTTPPSIHGGGTTQVSVGAFRLTIPSGWQVLEINRPMGAFERTEAVDPTGSELVIIDRDPGEPLPPGPWARSVEQETSQRADYARVSFSHGPLSGRQAIVWRFLLRDEPLPARVDVFQRVPSDGFAVYGEAATIPAATRVALAVAASLRPQ